MSVLKFSLVLQFVKLVECRTTLSPYGIHMCTDMCRQQGSCFSMFFSLDTLVCNLQQNARGRPNTDRQFYEVMLFKLCRPEDRSIMTKGNVHVCVKVQIDKAVYVAGVIPHCQYDLKTGSWSHVEQTEVPYRVNYNEESGFLYHVFAPNKTLKLGYRIERSSLSDPNQPTIFFQQNVDEGRINQLVVDGVQNIIFFTVQTKRHNVLYRKMSENPIAKVDLGNVNQIDMLTVNTIKGTLYCSILRPKSLKELSEITYDGSLVTTYLLPEFVLPILEFDKYENSLYTVAGGQRIYSQTTGLYKFILGSSRKFRLAGVVWTFTSLLLVSNNFIYAFGERGFIFSKDMTLIGNITGGCHDMPGSGYVLY